MGSQFSYGSGNRPIILNATERRPLSDRVLREIGSNTVINMTATGTDVSAGLGGFYNAGKVTRDSVGRYNVEVQTLTDGVPLGAVSMARVRIYENTAGVFLTVLDADAETEGGTAVNDADDTNLGRSGALGIRAGAFDVAGAGSDSLMTIAIADAVDVAALIAAGYAQAGNLQAQSLIVLDGLAAASHQVRMTRIQ